MNETNAKIVKHLREIAAYIECNDIPELISVAVSPLGGNRLHGWSADDNHLAMFVQWCDGIGAPVDITARWTQAGGFQIHGSALLADEETPVVLTAVLSGKESLVLANELGTIPGATVPVSRDLLAKIADPELLDDRAEVSF